MGGNPHKCILLIFHEIISETLSKKSILLNHTSKIIFKKKNSKQRNIRKVSCCSEMCQTGQIKVSGQGGGHLMYYPRKSDFPPLWICIVSAIFVHQRKKTKKPDYFFTAQAAARMAVKKFWLQKKLSINTLIHIYKRLSSYL